MYESLAPFTAGSATYTEESAYPLIAVFYQVAKEDIQAVIEGRFAGQFIIFPQFNYLPIIRLDELHEIEPEIAAKLEPDNMWTAETEEALFEKYYKG